MREVVLDTETTGLDPNSGDKIVEIGCVELVNHLATGRHYHQYINPERDIPEQAAAVHGLRTEFLADKPVFADIVEAFDEFIGDAKLIIHNAKFDMGFINAEREALEMEPLAMDRAIDTVSMARQKFPGAQANLDALCRRFQIDNSDRTRHGALKDAHLLAAVYLELIGGRQQGMELTAQERQAVEAVEKNRRQARPHAPSEEEAALHARFLKKLSAPIWKT